MPSGLADRAMYSRRCAPYIKFSFSGSLRVLCKNFVSILKPAVKRPVLFVGEGGVEVIDRNVWRGDQHRLGMGERIEAVFSVVVAHPGGPGTSERHRLDEQMNIHQIHAASTVG